MTPIRLSIAMANYNHAHFLKTRIPSILEQLGPSDELVIVDDGSTDDSVQLIRKYANLDSRVKLFCQKKNSGVISSANRAFQESRGKYLASLSADDELLPGFVEKSMQVLESDLELALCCSDCAMRYDGFSDKDPSKIYVTNLIEGATQVCIFAADQMTHIFSKSTFWIPGHTSVFRRDVVLQNGGLDARLGYHCDWFLMHSIAFFYGVAYIPESLSVWRQDKSSYSKKISPDYQVQIEMKIFEILSEKQNRYLRKQFRKSGLLRAYIRRNLLRFFFSPFYWDFLLSSIFVTIKNRFKRYMKKMLKIKNIDAVLK